VKEGAKLITDEGIEKNLKGVEQAFPLDEGLLAVSSKIMNMIFS
jgi:hypothetical protein